MAEAKRNESTQLKPVAGRRALLFERLVDEFKGTAGAAISGRRHGDEDLRRSVSMELRRLLNTRSPGIRWPGEELSRTVLDYGIADFSWMSPASPGDLLQLARLLEAAISTYEPRLSDVHVELRRSVRRPDAAVGVITGTLHEEKVIFPLRFGLKSGVVELGEVA